MKKWVNWTIVWDIAQKILIGLGKWCRFVWATLQWTFRPPFRPKNFFKQMEFIGVQSIPIILLPGVFGGIFFAFKPEKLFSLLKIKIWVGQKPIPVKGPVNKMMGID